MIEATLTSDGVEFHISAGLKIYLDNWAVIDLAEKNRLRRKRFVRAVCSGRADLLFSLTNAAELSEQRGESFDAVKRFLDEIGPRWVPVELNPLKIIERELQGTSPAESCISKGFMEAYVKDRIAEHQPGFKKGTILSPDFLRLGALVAWVAESKSLPKLSRQFDEVLKANIRNWPPHKRKRKWLDQNYAIPPFEPQTPATFVFRNLMRTVILEWGQLKDGDGMDFCHAVIGAAFANVAALDKHWKRRVEAIEGLPPSGLARIYSGQELDQLVKDIELWLRTG